MLDKNGNRMLCYIQKVDSVEDIQGADNIQLARVLGWTLIVKKNEFKPEDKCVFFEIDSKCPANKFFREDGSDVFDFLVQKHYNVRTYKLNKFGVISQGLILPLSSFNLEPDLEINTDLTERLGVTYAIVEKGKSGKQQSKEALEKNYMLKHKKFFNNKLVKSLMKHEFWRKLFLKNAYNKKVNGTFPSQYVSKTDEERVQNMPWVLNNKNPFIATEKIDGTSTTFLLVRERFHRFTFYVCSRNQRLLNDGNDKIYFNNDNIYWEMAIRYDVENQLKRYLKEHKKLKWVCIQGESYGEDWQGNRLKMKGHHFAAFNFKDSEKGRWNSIEAKNLLASWTKPIPWVPIIDANFILPDTVDEILKISTGKSSINETCLREGIVFRALDGQLSFKAVSPEYLMKHGI